MCDDGSDSKTISSASRAIKKKRRRSLSPSLGFAPGDLVWAMVRGYPYWPALVYPEPATRAVTKANSRKESTSVHVLFLSSKRQTAWVRDTNIVTFTGVDQFAHILADCPPKVAAQFRATKSLEPRLREAERAAVSLVTNTPEERLELTFRMDL